MVVVLDRITKQLALSALGGGAAIPFIPGFIDFQLVYNTGAAWGLLDGARGLFLVIAAIAVIAMIVYLLKIPRHATLAILGIGLVAGGAIGNAFDRATEGKVVDFIHTLFIDFPLFNVADSAITVGVILLIIVILFSKKAFPDLKEEAFPEGLQDETPSEFLEEHQEDLRS
jgi:signal peptidase II